MFIACSTTMGNAMPLAEVLKRIGNLGYDSVDILGIHQWAPHIQPGPWLDDPVKAKSDLDQLLDQYGLQLKCLNIGLNRQLYDRSPSGLQQRSEELTAYIRVMKAYGLHVAALQPGQSPDDPSDIFSDFVKTLDEIIKISQESEVTLALELHVGSPVGRLADANRILDAVPDLSIIYDPSHFAMQGITLSETIPLMSRTSHVHVRDASPGKLQVPYRTGTVDFDTTWEKLKDSGYQGGFSVEYIMTDEWDISSDLLKCRLDMLQIFN